ncbi:MAG: lamin tail domain-containing protein, partial [Planctomycetota bacterium]
MPLILPVLFFILLCSGLSADQVHINEVVASNVSGISDEDGNTSDWIELWNYGAAPVNVGGWGLSDNPAEPYKWVLPSMDIEAAGHLLVRASGKGSVDSNHDFITLIEEGDAWDVWPGNQAAPLNWNQPGFVPSGWGNGPSGFGFGDGDDATVINTDSIFIRKEFVLSQGDIDGYDQLFLHVDYDDGFVAYLNGVEIDRENMAGIDPPHTAFATDSHEAILFSVGTIGGKQIPDFANLLVAGTNVLALQVHNFNASSSDLSLVPFLTAAVPATFPGVPDPRLQIPNYRPLHTNFKLKAEGESLVL